MASQAPVTDRILGVVEQQPGCDMDTLAETLPELSWNQLFLEIDRLSRQGDILVTCKTGGRYLIQLPEHKTSPNGQQARL